MGNDQNKKMSAKKADQLGMPFGTATNRLKKSLLFALVQELNWDNCYRCGDKILEVKDLSVEHKNPWLDSDDPIGLFFDLSNVTFSHLKCNCGSYNREKAHCKSGHLLSGDNVYARISGGSRACRTCHDVYRKRHREKKRAELTSTPTKS